MKAIVHFDAVLELIDPVTEPRMWAAAKNNQALAWMERSSVDPAVRYERAVEITRAMMIEGANATSRRIAHARLFLLRLNRPGTEIRFADEAEVDAARNASWIALDQVATPETARSLLTLADALTRRKQGPREVNLREAISICERVANFPPSPEVDDIRLQALIVGCWAISNLAGADTAHACVELPRGAAFAKAAAQLASATARPEADVDNKLAADAVARVTESLRFEYEYQGCGSSTPFEQIPAWVPPVDPR